jgi:hypothetical protein
MRGNKGDGYDRLFSWYWWWYRGWWILFRSEAADELGEGRIA